MTQGIAAVLLFIGVMFVPEKSGGDSAHTQMQHFADLLAGNWSIKFTVKPVEALPEGGSGHGYEVWKPGPGGLSFVEEYHSVGDEGEITGSGTYWWDQRLNRISVLWCASYLPSGCEIMSEGASWDGENRLILKNQWEAEGKKHAVKEVFSDISEASFTQTIYEGENFDKLRVAYVFHAKKTSLAGKSR